MYPASASNYTGSSVAGSKMSSDLGSTSDDEFVSSASTASADDEGNPLTEGPQSQMALPIRSVVKRTASKDSASSDCLQKPLPGMAGRQLHLLDLPMDILKEIIKEVSTIGQSWAVLIRAL